MALVCMKRPKPVTLADADAAGTIAALIAVATVWNTTRSAGNLVLNGSINISTCSYNKHPCGTLDNFKCFFYTLLIDARHEIVAVVALTAGIFLKSEAVHLFFLAAKFKSRIPEERYFF